MNERGMYPSGGQRSRARRWMSPGAALVVIVGVGLWLASSRRMVGREVGSANPIPAQSVGGQSAIEDHQEPLREGGRPVGHGTPRSRPIDSNKPHADAPASQPGADVAVAARAPDELVPDDLDTAEVAEAETFGPREDSDLQRTAPAPPNPSWVLDSKSWARAEGKVPPAISAGIRDGEYEFVVEEPPSDAILHNLSSDFWSASRRNIGLFTVNSECGLARRAAPDDIAQRWFGVPFPVIERGDPNAGCKVGWNLFSVSALPLGEDSAITLSGIDETGEFTRLRFDTETLNFVGPRDVSVENPEGVRTIVRTTLLEPLDVDGVAGLRKRIHDWTSHDKVWFFVPSTRRIRRVGPATLSDPMGGLDLFAADIDGFGEKTEAFRWKVIGEGEALAPFTGLIPLRGVGLADAGYRVEFPYPKGAYETPGSHLIPWAITSNLRLVQRPVWIVELRSRDPYYNFGRVILWVDRELYRVYWRQVFSREGRDFYNVMIAHHFTSDPQGKSLTVLWTAIMTTNLATRRGALARKVTSEILGKIPPPPPVIPLGMPMAD